MNWKRKQMIHRRDGLRVALALGLSFIARSVRAHKYYVPHLRISHPWCRATPADAQSAAICMTFDEVLRADRLIGVETPLAAGAEMGGVGAGPVVDFPIPAGQESVLSEEGTFVRLVGLRQALELGRFYPLRLVFERGGPVEASVDVSYASLG